jgi:hypothetical protein
MSETDSFSVKVTARTTGALEQAIGLVMRDHPKGVGWWADVDGWLTFYWSAPSVGAALPVSMLATAVAPIVAGWLGEHQPPRTSKPDTDGDALAGFELHARMDAPDGSHCSCGRPVRTESERCGLPGCSEDPDL